MNRLLALLGVVVALSACGQVEVMTDAERCEWLTQREAYLTASGARGPILTHIRAELLKCEPDL